jgi:hypothetical protein
MIAPKWLTAASPLRFLMFLNYYQDHLFNSQSKSFDIGGPDILTYREMLLGYAEAKNLKDGFDCSSDDS